MFSQESLKKAEGDADEIRFDRDMFSDQYRSAVSRNNALDETIALREETITRLNEVASRNVYRIWELENAKPNVVRIEDLEKKVRTLKKELENGGPFVEIGRAHV